MLEHWEQRDKCLYQHTDAKFLTVCWGKGHFLDKQAHTRTQTISMNFSSASLELKMMPSGHIWANYSALPLGLCAIWTPIAWWYLHNSPDLSGGEASASHVQHEEDRDKRVFSNPWQLMTLLRNCKGAWLELQLNMQHTSSKKSPCLCGFRAWSDNLTSNIINITKKAEQSWKKVGILPWFMTKGWRD